MSNKKKAILLSIVAAAFAVPVFASSWILGLWPIELRQDRSDRPYTLTVQFSAELPIHRLYLEVGAVEGQEQLADEAFSRLTAFVSVNGDVLELNLEPSADKKTLSAKVVSQTDLGQADVSVWLHDTAHPEDPMLLSVTNP